MKKYFSIIGTCLGLASFLMILYVTISGIVNSARLGTWDIFDTIILPITIISTIFAGIIFILTLKNINKKSLKVFEILTVIISFVLGFLYIWFACVKTDNIAIYAVIGSLSMICCILLIINLCLNSKENV